MVYTSNRSKVIDFVDAWFEARDELPYADARVWIQQKIKCSPNLLDAYLSDLVEANRISYNKLEKKYVKV